MAEISKINVNGTEYSITTNYYIHEMGLGDTYPALYKQTLGPNLYQDFIKVNVGSGSGTYTIHMPDNTNSYHILSITGTYGSQGGRHQNLDYSQIGFPDMYKDGPNKDLTIKYTYPGGGGDQIYFLHVIFTDKQFSELN